LRALAVLALAAAILPAQQYRAFWADAFHAGFKSPAEVDQMVDDVASAHGNAIFVQVRRRADSYYLETKEVPAQDAAYSPGFDALRYLIERAHARGIEVHAWFVVYPVWPTTIAPPLNPRHIWHAHGPRASGPEMWMDVSSTGAIGGAFDPGHPGVQAYLADVITDPVGKYDLDGVHLDYVRYQELTASSSNGWNPVAVERFNRLEGRAGSPALRDPAWAEFRRRQVTQLVRQIYLRTIEMKPWVKVSAALISWGNGPLTDAAWASTDAYATVFQDWRSWVEEGILDIAMPMHYFDDRRNASFLDRWVEFAKDRQFRRRYLPGLGVYLNDIDDSVSQIRRALAPSAAGNTPAGVVFYSYASTNRLNAAGLPITPNSEFYRRVGEFFGAPAAPPVLDWKVRPSLGHIAGRLTVTGGPEWLNDGVTVDVSSDTGAAAARSGVTDGTGAFGFVDLPPDRYRLRLSRGGRVLFDATPRDVVAGRVTRFDVRLSPADFTGVLPRNVRFAGRVAAPGDIVTIEGENLAGGEAYAGSVPLPGVLGGVSVIVNGTQAPLYSVTPSRIVLVMPYQSAPRWTAIVRRDGMDSNPADLDWAAANPVILGVRRAAPNLLEIYATGLGAVEPPLAAGLGADPSVGLSRVAQPVTVEVNGNAVTVVYAGLSPYVPGRYQVNADVGEAAGGVVRLVVAGAVSNSVAF